MTILVCGSLAFDTIMVYPHQFRKHILPDQMHILHVADVRDATLAIISPDGRDGMVEHARDLAAAGIPYIFDPGQGLPMFSGDDLMALMSPSKLLAVNDYEARIVEQKTGLAIQAIA